MVRRLWDKGEALDEAVQQFTIGNDPQLDRALIRWDCVGSAAHAQMLCSIGLLNKKECQAILDGLREAWELGVKEEFDIPFELEDGHTAIESFLVEKIGEAGKRVHAGRSRNDQIITAMRLYLRHQTLSLIEELSAWNDALSKRYDELKDVDMPGYTHLQRAMPSSFGMWLEAFDESVLDLIREGFSILDALDSNPLGAAAGFGTSLGLDRKLTAKLLGFSRVQRNPIDVQNSRGRYELRFLRWTEAVATIVEKLAWDMQLYVTEEFGFISLPNELTTGSSIMPQKRNPDVLELLRGRAARVRGAASELAWVTAKMPSNYHRDFQYTKEPVMKAVGNVFESVRLMAHAVSTFTINPDALKEAMSADLYATYEAYRLVKDGKPFRDAYRETSKQVADGTLDVDALSADFAEIKTSIDIAMSEARAEQKALDAQAKDLRGKLDAVEAGVFLLKA
jgi:argininosuccinate lyase